MQRLFTVLTILVLCGCSDATSNQFDEPEEQAAPVQVPLPECDAEFACFYDGYVAQAILVDGQWVVAGGEGAFRVETNDPRPGIFVATFEGEYVDAFYDCVEDPRLARMGSIYGPFEGFEFREGCEATREGGSDRPVSFEIEVDGRRFAESHDPAEPPALSLEKDLSSIRIVPDDPNQAWSAYLVEDEPGLDRETFFMTIRGNADMPEHSIYIHDNNIDAPFSIYAVGRSGGASMIETASESFVLGLALENWDRIGGGDPDDFR